MVQATRYLLNVGKRGGFEFEQVVEVVRDSPILVDATKGRILQMLVRHFLENPPPGNWVEQTLKLIRNQDFDEQRRGQEERDAIRAASKARGEKTRALSPARRTYRKDTFATNEAYDAAMPPPSLPLEEPLP